MLVDCLVHRNGFFQLCTVSQINAHVSKNILDEQEKASEMQLIVETQSHLCFHLCKSSFYLRALFEAGFVFEDTECVGVIFSLLTVFSSGIPPDFFNVELRISPDILVDFSPQLHSMMFSGEINLIRTASYLLTKLATSENYDYIKLEICAEWYFASGDDLKKHYFLVLHEICNMKEVTSMTVFMDGLTRISATWEEKWFDELQKQYSEISKLFRRIHPHLSQIITSNLPKEEKNIVLENTVHSLLDPLGDSVGELITLTEADVLKTPAGILFWEKYEEKLKNLYDLMKSHLLSETDLERKKLCLKMVLFFLMSYI